MVKPLSAKFFICISVIAISFSSCKKETDDIGLGLLSSDTIGVAFTDTSTLITHTVKKDSLSTGQASTLFCGNYFDPYFGITNTSFFSEVFPSSTGTVSFGTAPIIDSIVLSLVYKAYYGKPAPQTFKVFQMTGRIYKDSIYFSDTTINFNSLPIASIVKEPNNRDSVFADGANRVPHLRIPLDVNTLGPILLNTANYTTTEDFLKALNGIYVTADNAGLSGNRAIYSFIPGNSYSRITMYYKNQNDGYVKQNLYTFQMGGNTARFNRFEHDYSFNPDISNQITTSDTVQQSVVYVQGLAGLQTKIYLPYLKSFYKNGAVVINKAELVLKMDPATFDSYFSAPSQLAVVGIDSTGKEILIPDQLEQGSYYGGVFDFAKKEYRFNINRYVQQVLIGKIKPYGLMLAPIGGAINPNRVVLGGGKKGVTNQMKLNIVYTKIY
jgi:hypothetical protein